MVSDINLIPQTEVVEQKKTKAVKASTIFSIVILFISLSVGAYYYMTISNIKGRISQLDVSITSLRGKIQGLSEIEVSARNLNKKYIVLDSLFSKRPKYSLLLKELKDRKPSEVTIESLDVRSGRIDVSGSATDYVSISNFVNNLTDKNFDGGNPSLKNLFTEVSLNSVSLEKATSSIKFFILVSYQESSLHSK